MIFTKNYKVYINHTDAGGIVYHANHLTFFENCRRDWLTSLGFDGYFFDLSALDATSTQNAHHGAVHFVVSQANLQYHSPLLIDDELTVSIESIQVRPASLILQQNIYRPNQSKPATTSTITLACVHNDGKNIVPHRLPATFITRLNTDQ